MNNDHRVEEPSSSRRVSFGRMLSWTRSNSTPATSAIIQMPSTSTGSGGASGSRNPPAPGAAAAGPVLSPTTANNIQRIEHDLHQMILGISRSAAAHSQTLPQWLRTANPVGGASGSRTVGTTSSVEAAPFAQRQVSEDITSGRHHSAQLHQHDLPSVDAMPQSLSMPSLQGNMDGAHVIEMNESSVSAPGNMHGPSTSGGEGSGGTAPNTVATTPSQDGAGAPPNGQDVNELINNHAELRNLLAFADHYVAFVFILLLKLAFDHRIGLLVILGLFVTFCHANTVIKREVGKQSKRQLSSLIIIATNTITCVCFVYLVLAEDGLASALILMPPYTERQEALDLIWILVVTDFVIKLITVLIKALIVALPGVICSFPRRGKFYLFVEAVSQLYRAIVPVQHWFIYFSEAYEGTAKILGVCLAAAYFVVKCREVLLNARQMKRAIVQVMRRVSYGTAPSADEIKASGDVCPICHDEFRQPVMLSCSHIFCEECVSVWFDRETTCPMCRAQIADDPTWRDGSTTMLVQLF